MTCDSDRRWWPRKVNTLEFRITAIPSLTALSAGAATQALAQSRILYHLPTFSDWFLTRSTLSRQPTIPGTTTHQEKISLHQHLFGTISIAEAHNDTVHRALPAKE